MYNKQRYKNKPNWSKKNMNYERKVEELFSKIVNESLGNSHFAVKDYHKTVAFSDRVKIIKMGSLFLEYYSKFCEKNIGYEYGYVNPVDRRSESVKIYLNDDFESFFNILKDLITIEVCRINFTMMSEILYGNTFLYNFVNANVSEKFNSKRHKGYDDRKLGRSSYEIMTHLDIDINYELKSIIDDIVELETTRILNDNLFLKYFHEDFNKVFKGETTIYQNDFSLKDYEEYLELNYAF